VNGNNAANWRPPCEMTKVSAIKSDSQRLWNPTNTVYFLQPHFHVPRWPSDVRLPRHLNLDCLDLSSSATSQQDRLPTWPDCGPVSAAGREEHEFARSQAWLTATLVRRQDDDRRRCDWMSRHHNKLQWIQTSTAYHLHTNYNIIDKTNKHTV